MAQPGRPRRRRLPGRPGPAGSGRVRQPVLPVNWQQYDALLDSFAHRHTGRHIEQVSWLWHGPLDVGRFAAAWQSVVERETVLRAAFDWLPDPHVVLHEHARADVVRHRAGGIDWEELLERDRLRGFDLRRPAPLRLTLLELSEQPVHRLSAVAGPPPVTRVLLTFHHALLDAWSAYVLLDEFGRAYLCGGALPGGERRPDIRDWNRWLEDQDPVAARDFWHRAVPPGRPVLLPARPGPETRQRGSGRAEAGLSAAEAGRLHRWAASRAVSDSSVLHAVWAMLLLRAAGTGGPVTVGFGITASGRGITLDAAERLVGPMRTLLPMAVRIDPAHQLGQLLAALRDRALDMAAYEWVSAGQVHAWAGRARGFGLLDSLVSVEALPRQSAELRAGLSAAGIRFEQHRASGAYTGFPVALLAHPGADGSLALTALHDRARISDTDAGLLLAHCLRLLRHLPDTGEGTTVADVLAVLGTEDAPRVAPGRRAGKRPAEWLGRRSAGAPPPVEDPASKR